MMKGLASTVGQKIAYVNCVAGVSATQLLSAVLDAGLPAERLQEVLFEVPLFAPYTIHCDTERTPAAGNSTGSLALLVLSADLPEPSPLTFAAWMNMFDDADGLSLPPSVLSSLMRAMRMVAEASMVVSGVSVSQVLLAVREVAEMYAVISALHMLDVHRVYATPLPLLSASPPSPQATGAAPLMLDQRTLEIARRAALPWQPVAAPLAQLTATGVALLATLAEWSTPALVIERIGYGFSADAPRQAANVLHLYIGQDNATATAEGGEMESDWVAVIESHIDNMSGELLGGLMERLFSAGALDVTFSPLQMKKNRPASLITVIAPQTLGETLSLLLLRETSTLGVRIQHVRRLKAQREQQRIETALGSALVKVKRLGARVVNATPEYDECQRLAHEHDLPLLEVYEIVRDAIRRTIMIQ